MVGRLRRLLDGASVLMMPTAHDPLSAWLCEMAGFEAVLVSRGAVARATLASDDPLDLEDEALVARVAEICRLVSVPVMVDLTPVSTQGRRLRNTVTALALSGVAGIIVDDLDGDRAEPGVLVPQAFHERLSVARQGLLLRGLDLVTVARTFALAHGVTTPLGAVSRLATDGSERDLVVVDGLDVRDLHRWAVASGAVSLMLLDHDLGDEDLVARTSEQPGVRAVAWTRPLLDGAVAGMRRTLSRLNGDDAADAVVPATTDP